MKKQAGKILAIVLSGAVFISAILPSILVPTTAASEDRTMSFNFKDANSDNCVDDWVQAGGLYFIEDAADISTAISGLGYGSQYSTINTAITNARKGSPAVQLGTDSESQPIYGMQALPYANRTVKKLNNDTTLTPYRISGASEEFSMYKNTAFSNENKIKLKELSGKVNAAGISESITDSTNGTALIVYDYIDKFTWKAITIFKSSTSGKYNVAFIAKSCETSDGVTKYYSNADCNNWRTDYYISQELSVESVSTGFVDFKICYNENNVAVALSTATQSDSWTINNDLSVKYGGTTSVLTSGTNQRRYLYNPLDGTAYTDTSSVNILSSAKFDSGCNAKNFALGCKYSSGCANTVYYKDVSVKYSVDNSEAVATILKRNILSFFPKMRIL